MPKLTVPWLKNDRVGSLEEGKHGVCELLTPGGLVRGDGNLTHEDFDFRQHALRNRFASDREGGGAVFALRLPAA